MSRRSSVVESNLSRSGTRDTKIKALLVTTFKSRTVISSADYGQVELSKAVESFTQQVYKLLESDTDEENEGITHIVDTEYSNRSNSGRNNNRNYEEDNGNKSSCKGKEKKIREYVCPEQECRKRKPDKSLKDYQRHYEIHVPCKVPCAACSKVCLHVAALRRHYAECPQIKKRVNLGGYEEEMQAMRDQRDKETKKAVTKAKERLNFSKRQLNDINDPRSSKRRRREQQLDQPSLSIQPSSERQQTTALNISPLNSIDGSLPGYCKVEGNINNSVSQVSRLGDITDELFSSFERAPLPGNDPATDIESLQFIGQPAMFSAENQQSVPQDPNEITGNPNFPEITSYESSEAARLLSTEIFATRSKSFTEYTMDGSTKDMLNEHSAVKTQDSNLAAISQYYPNTQTLDKKATDGHGSNFELLAPEESEAGTYIGWQCH